MRHLSEALHLLVKKAVILLFPSFLVAFAALPLLVALRVPCFLVGVLVGDAVFLIGDADKAGFGFFCSGSASAVRPSSPSSLRSRLIPFASSVGGSLVSAGTGNGALSSVPSTRSVVTRDSLTSCSSLNLSFLATSLSPLDLLAVLLLPKKLAMLFLFSLLSMGTRNDGELLPTLPTSLLTW